jgi:hypothetical protein
MKLSQEDKDVLQDWLHTESAVVVKRALSGVAEAVEREVLSCTSDEGDRLVRLRAQGEGARKLLIAWENLLQQIKGSTNGSGRAKGKGLR